MILNRGLLPTKLAGAMLLPALLLGGGPAHATVSNPEIQNTNRHTGTELPPVAIKIVPGSTIHLVARSSKLPISIQNDFPVNLRVQVHVAPNSLNALIPATIEVTVPANTTFVALVPVNAIADGPVQLHAWLTTFSGLSLGDAVDLNLVINAEIEESLFLGFVILVAGLGVVGVIRTRNHRRRERKAGAE